MDSLNKAVPEYQDIVFFSPTSSLLTGIILYAFALYSKTLSTEGELLSVNEDTLGCDHPLIREIDEQVGLRGCSSTNLM